MLGSTANCTEVTPSCPASDSFYGYTPSHSANITFGVIFCVCLVLQLILGICWRTWSYMVAVGLGCFIEALGYLGRALASSNPYNSTYIRIEEPTLTIAPAFLAAGIYLTLKHSVIVFGRSHSRLRAELYTWLFVGCDIVSILVQAGGGGAQAIASNRKNLSLANIGNDIVIGGVSFQVFTLLIFAVLSCDYVLRLRRARLEGNQEVGDDFSRSVADKAKLKKFLFAIAVSYLVIFIRCVYRIAQMSHGYESALWKNQGLFIVFDNVMVSIAAILMTVFHPGYWFPEMKTRKNSDVRGKEFTEYSAI